MRLVVGLRPVSDTLDGTSAGGLGAGVAGWAGPEPSLRHVRQAWPAGGQFGAEANYWVCIHHSKLEPW